MTLRSNRERFGHMAKAFHWTTVLLVLALLAIGLVMVDQKETGSRLAVYRWHVGLGLAVLAVTALRLVWRLIDRPPPAPSLRRWELISSRIMHTILYLALFLLPASGLATLAGADALPAIFGLADPSPLPARFELVGPRAAHRVIVIALVSFASFHALAGMYHHWLRKDEVLRRMLPWRG